MPILDSNEYIDVKDFSAVTQFQRNPTTTTDKYTRIDTLQLVEQLESKGWHAVNASQKKVRKVEREGYQTHLIHFKNKELQDLMPGLAIPSLLMKHSHDGSSALQLLLALKVAMCDNGCYWHSGDMGSVRILHRGFTQDKLDTALNNFMLGVPVMAKEVEEFRSTKLDQEEQLLYAQKALELRYDPITDSFGQPTNNYPVTARQVLQARYNRESPNTLWGAFQLSQENLIDKGGLRAQTINGRRQTTRKVAGVDSNIRLNQNLWALTKRMADIKQGRIDSNALSIQ